MPSNLHIPETGLVPATGTLYVVATPIGNLEDITLRVLRVLGEVDWIAAEDTRHTRQLLSAHRISSGRLISCHEHNEQQRTPELLEKLTAGESVALVSNAGTPTVSDPGYRLVRAAIEQGLTVVPVPGVSAAMTALSVSGLPTDAFTFIGFPPRSSSKRLQLLHDLSAGARTLIFYQSPRRLISFLDEILDIMGDRPAVVGREMTKLHEEFVRGTVARVRSVLGERDEIKGECTVLIGGAGRQQKHDTGEDLHQSLSAALADDQRPLSAIAREIARRSGRTRKEIYELALRIRAGQKP